MFLSSELHTQKARTFDLSYFNYKAQCYLLFTLLSYFTSKYYLEHQFISNPEMRSSHSEQLRIRLMKYEHQISIDVSTRMRNTLYETM